jgi:hypothetical protein
MALQCLHQKYRFRQGSRHRGTHMGIWSGKKYGNFRGFSEETLQNTWFLGRFFQQESGIWYVNMLLLVLWSLLGMVVE